MKWILQQPDWPGFHYDEPDLEHQELGFRLNSERLVGSFDALPMASQGESTVDIMRYFLHMRIFSLLALTIVSLSAVEYGVACDNPAKHPGSAEYVALLESLRGQPQGAVQMMYKLGDIRLKGFPIPVTLSFWPIRPYDNGQIVVTPSAGLELVDSPGTLPVPNKDSVDLVIKPKSNGFHYLKIETIILEGQKKTRNTAAIAVSVGGHGEGDAGFLGDNRFGFAGPRFKEMLS